jgi:hypothetical protein
VRASSTMRSLQSSLDAVDRPTRYGHHGQPSQATPIAMRPVDLPTASRPMHATGTALMITDTSDADPTRVTGVARRTAVDGCPDDSSSSPSGGPHVVSVATPLIASTPVASRSFHPARCGVPSPSLPEPVAPRFLHYRAFPLRCTFLPSTSHLITYVYAVDLFAPLHIYANQTGAGLVAYERGTEKVRLRTAGQRSYLVLTAAGMRRWMERWRWNEEEHRPYRDWLQHEIMGRLA